MSYPSDRTFFRTLPALFLFALLLQNVPGSQAQHLQGDRIMRGSFLEIRSYNRELGNFWGYGGFGGELGGSGPIFGAVTVTGGFYPEKTGTHVAHYSALSTDGQVMVDKTFDGWGFDIKYQYHAFLNGKVDESGVFLKWGTAFHLARFDVDYSGLPQDLTFEDLNIEEGHRDKVEFYFESAAGYQFDLGFTNLTMELEGGFPTVTGIGRAFGLALGGGEDETGVLVDIDDDATFFAMPFYYGFKASLMI